MSSPNRWAWATVKNDWGSTISDVQLNHRYDNDHYDSKSWPEIKQGQTGESFHVHYWTGLGRTGKDYWRISFEVDGKVWSCKQNFYCFLTRDDQGKTVTCRVYKDGEGGKMKVIAPGSSDCTVSLSPKVKKSSGDARPVYVIGHRCNDPEDIGRAISQGCNAIECDLQYDSDKKEIFVNHDYKAGSTLSAWLGSAKRIAELYPEQFALIIFDLKFAAEAEYRDRIAGQALAKVQGQVRDLLTGQAKNPINKPINILFSIASYKDRNAFADIWRDLRPNEGIAIDASDKPSEVEAFFKENKVENCYYADGITSVLLDNAYENVKNGTKLRDNNKIIKKVYAWTLAKEKTIRKYVEEAQVDGVMVNVPGTLWLNSPAHEGLERALKVVHELATTRLAKRSDQAFTVHEKIIQPVITIPNPIVTFIGTSPFLISGNNLMLTSARVEKDGQQIEVKGRFSYLWNDKPLETGEQLPIGQHTLSVKFTPDDTAKYAPAQTSVQIDVLKATPTITWPTPTDIVHGTPLGDKQLNATAWAEIDGKQIEVKGSFSYLWQGQPIRPGGQLPAGKHTLSVLFTPDDPGIFEGASESIQLRIWLDTYVFGKYEKGNEETFSHLALKYYGHATPYYWQWIIDANMGNIPEDYRHTRPGTKVFIPEAPPPPGKSRKN